MSSVSDVSVVRIPSSAVAPGEPAEGEPGAPRLVGAWSPVELPPPRRPSPATLTALALLAGIGAMALGGLAVVSATRSAEEPGPTVAAAPAQARQEAPAAERRALALLAKPSTRRIGFRGSAGRLLLVVGSGGRAAILVRGLEPASAARPYHAWVIRPGSVVRAARLTGAERAVLLSAPVGQGHSVVVAADRASALRPGRGRLVAIRG